ncbi:alkaline phosphatase D family protein [Actinophytocola sp.]|uniref:alkaline phosphatase D family protein n=1 Tax=Actinophytocola sp. TaxID=1872138 RepID=UPI002ED60D76
MTNEHDRRRFLSGAMAVAGAAALGTLPAGTARASTPGGYPFGLGVASGDPTASGVVLWTRLVPRLFEPGGGMPATPVTVDWQIAADPHFRRVVRDGTAWALPSLGHSVHVEVDGLRPDGEWYYRFRHGRHLSPVGRTRTAPADGMGRLALAVASCQAWDNGFYPSYRHMADEDLDLVLHLGDYVYEGGVPADGGYRHTPTPDVLRAAPRDLARWRMQYELYKSDPDLQAAHARFPWTVTWDDHHVCQPTTQ